MEGRIGGGEGGKLFYVPVKPPTSGDVGLRVIPLETKIAFDGRSCGRKGTRTPDLLGVSETL